ncbi:Hypothetical protein SRAE_2000273300 [Strongyloides ratti]|uniref:Uncharacterized protein n=1 Tax=Strongyloides ratti TaxID=34506 RepID=A0A090LKI7_STRRB|nr:Hypothetical protein SRAE_2000273300 [Strongyloides ratti]CEF68075.1 Hypothetical protein SRAE_2000273300 [Strongyloides ratti]
MKKVFYFFLFNSLTFGEYLFYDAECPTNISKLEKSFYTAFRVSNILTNSITVNIDFELVSITYNKSNFEEIIRIDGSARFPKNEVWTKKYIPIKSWPLYLHPNCLKFFSNGNECLPNMDALIFYQINSDGIKEPFRFKKYKFEQFFPCEPNNVISFVHDETISLQNKSSVFISREKPIYYIQDFNFEEFSLDNLYKYSESESKYVEILSNLEEFEEFTIDADINFKYDFEEPSGPFKKVSDIFYENGKIIEL